MYEYLNSRSCFVFVLLLCLAAWLLPLGSINASVVARCSGGEVSQATSWQTLEGEVCEWHADVSGLRGSLAMRAGAGASAWHDLLLFEAVTCYKATSSGRIATKILKRPPRAVAQEYAIRREIFGTFSI